jgi:PAS domain S-box-containing protein
MTQRPTYEELEQKVFNNQAWFHAVIETAEDSIFIKNHHLKYTLVNPAMERLFGLPASQLLGKSDEELFGEEAGAHIREIDSCVLKGEIIDEEDTKPVAGVPKTFHVIKVPLRNDSGKIIGLCGIARDVTKQKQTEMALKNAHDELEQIVKERTAELVNTNQKFKQSEESYRTFIDSTLDLVFLKDEHFRHVIVNNAYSKYLGKKEHEIIGKTDFELLPKHMAEACRQSDLNALKSKGPFVSEERNKDRIYETRKFSVNFGNGKYGIGGYVRDISEGVKDKEALKKAHDELEHRVKERTKELQIKTKSLEETNIALKVLLKKRVEDKEEIQDNVMTNVKELIAPFFKKIKKTKLDDQQKLFFGIIESNLNEIISPFTRKMSLKYLNLTPTEIRIANLIKYGSSSKEIAELMNVSPRTVETHRKNIRRKIGLEGKRVNLRSYLLSLH